MKKLVMMAIASSALIVSGSAIAKSGADSPTLTNNSSCMAKGRAPLNSTGGLQTYGDRTKGGFGEAQSAFVAYLESIGMGYGEWLQGSEWAPQSDNCPLGD